MSLEASRHDDVAAVLLDSPPSQQRASISSHAATATGTIRAAVIRNGMADEQEHPEPVIVGTFPSVGEAEIAQARLRAYGIDSALVDNDGGGTIPVDSDDGIDLAVRAADAQAAAEILTDTAPA